MKVKVLEAKEAKGEKIHSPKKVASLMKQEAKADREALWVLHLNSQNQIIEKELVSLGIVDASLVHPREVFKKAIINGAASIITVHNHPSGNCEPSPEDHKTWDRLKKAGEILGIKVTDNLIVTPNGKYFSEGEEGEA